MSRESGIGNRESGIGDRESGIGDRESGIGDRGSGIGDREAGIGNRESGSCCDGSSGRPVHRARLASTLRGMRMKRMKRIERIAPRPGRVLALTRERRGNTLGTPASGRPSPSSLSPAWACPGHGAIRLIRPIRSIPITQSVDSRLASRGQSGVEACHGIGNRQAVALRTGEELQLLPALPRVRQR
jgi:hypothetical protein